MSINPILTHVNPTTSLYAALGSGGGGGGQNLVVSTIVMEGSTDPLEITLPAAPNDGFSVRQGGVSNPIAILTIDAANAGQAEFGIRSLSTIGGNPVPRGRFEQTLVPGTDIAQLSYTLDTVGSGNASTIGAIEFKPGSGVNITATGGAGLSIGNYQVQGNSLACLNPRVANATANIYVPASGATQTVTQFSTIAGNVYEVFIPNMRIQNEPAGAPAAGAWSQLIVDAVGQLDTFDMASVSTIDNDLQLSRNYSFTANANGHALQCIGSLSNTVSTAFTFSPYVYVRDIGNPTFMLAANAAP